MQLHLRLIQTYSAPIDLSMMWTILYISSKHTFKKKTWKFWENYRLED